MRISCIKTWKQVMPLSEPYTIAYKTYSSITAIFIRIETDSGISGFGSATLDFHVTDEKSDSVYSSIINIIEPMILEEDPLRYLYRLEKIFPDNNRPELLLI